MRAVSSEGENGLVCYMVLKSNIKTNYLVKCPDIEDEPLVLTGTEISNSLYLMAGHHDVQQSDIEISAF